MHPISLNHKVALQNKEPQALSHSGKKEMADPEAVSENE